MFLSIARFIDATVRVVTSNRVDPAFRGRVADWIAAGKIYTYHETRTEPNSVNDIHSNIPIRTYIRRLKNQ